MTSAIEIKSQCGTTVPLRARRIGDSGCYDSSGLDSVHSRSNASYLSSSPASGSLSSSSNLTVSNTPRLQFQYHRHKHSTGNSIEPSPRAAAAMSQRVTPRSPFFKRDPSATIWAPESASASDSGSDSWPINSPPNRHKRHVSELISRSSGAFSFSPSSASVLASTSRERMAVQLLGKLREIPLKEQWVLWTVDAAQSRSFRETWHTAEEYARHLTPVASIRSLQHLWHLLEDEVEPHHVTCSRHVFKAGARPLWEDDCNIYGGQLTIRLSRRAAEATAFFRQVLLAATSGVLDGLLMGSDLLDAVVGCSLVSKSSGDFVSVWTRDASNQTGIDRIRQYLQRDLPALANAHAFSYRANAPRWS
ncbi:hypothetical protein PYCC9005_001122 [Savitreella phatthalungensis]